MEGIEKKRFFIMDGNAYIYRAFYAIEELSTSTGIPTNAVFGFTRLLLKLLLEDEPDYMVIAFDSAGPTFRHKEFAEYKADRPAMPDPLAQQLPIIREVIETLNITILELSGYEADDIIGTMARKAESAGMEVTVVTVDVGNFDAISLAVHDSARSSETFFALVIRYFDFVPAGWSCFSIWFSHLIASVVQGEPQPLMNAEMIEIASSIFGRFRVLFSTPPSGSTSVKTTS